MRNKRSVVITTILVISILIITVSLTYAFFQAQGGETVTRDVRIQTHTTDQLTFDIDDDIDFEVTQADFEQGKGNKSDEASITAILTPNSGTGEATEQYNIFLLLAENEIVYSETNTNHYPELLLQVFDDEDQLVTLTGLGNQVTYDTLTGYDITGKDGLITILSNHSISATGGDITTEEWRIVITMINLDVDQEDNTGKNVSADLIIQKGNRIETYKPTKIATKMMLDNGYTSINSVPERSSFTSYSPSEGNLFRTNNAEMGDPVLYYAGPNPNNWVVMGQVTLLEDKINVKKIKWSEYDPSYDNFKDAMISNGGLCILNNYPLADNNGNLISQSTCNNSNSKLKVCLTTDGAWVADSYSISCEAYDETWIQVTEYGNPTWLAYGEQEYNTYDLYWRIIRTNEESTGGGIRLLYSGSGAAINQNGTKKIDPDVNNSTLYDVVDNGRSSYFYYNKYDLGIRRIGYTYGNSNDSLDTIRGINDSLAKDRLDDWYDDYIVDAGLSTLIDTKAVYCNDRSYTDSSTWPNNIEFASTTRISGNSPSFACGATASGYPNFYTTGDNNADRYTGETYELGNGLLGNRPVALMTADEIFFAGRTRSSASNSWITRNPNNENIVIGEIYSAYPHPLKFYTMSPTSYTSIGIYVDNLVDARTESNGGYSFLGVRPVLSIKKDVKVTGNGTPTDPYIVVTN